MYDKIAKFVKNLKNCKNCKKAQQLNNRFFMSVSYSKHLKNTLLV